MSLPTPRSHPLRLGPWILIVCVAASLVVAIKLAGVFFLSREANDLQAALSESAGGTMDGRIRFSLGPGLLAVGRTVIPWIDDLPPQVSPVLRALQHVSVGIYQLDQTPTAATRDALIAAADSCLQPRGWERIVAVSSPDETVLVYASSPDSTGDELRLCLAICSERELVVVSARATLVPLLELARLPLPTGRQI